MTVYHFFPEGSCLVISSSLCKVVLHDEGRGGQNAVLRCSTFTITDGPQALGRRSAICIPQRVFQSRQNAANDARKSLLSQIWTLGARFHPFSEKDVSDRGEAAGVKLGSDRSV